MRDAVRRFRAWLLRCRTRMSGRAVGVAVVYHALARHSGDPARELVAPHGTDLFRGQLRHLRAHYRVVPAADLARAVERRRRWGRIPVAVTFDDDLRSHVELAAPILAAERVHATFFLTGGGLEGPVRFWWERLTEVWNGTPAAPDRLRDRTGAAPGASLEDVAGLVENWPAERRIRFDAELREEAGPDPADAGLRAAEVRSLADAGHHVGFHTRHHHNLTTLTPEELEEALDEGRDRLAAAAGAGLRTLAYPHGRADPGVAAGARAAGFELAFTTVAHPATPDTDPHRIGRYWPLYDTVEHFALDVAQIASRAPSRSGGQR